MDDFTPSQWAWEFLRRNTEYIKAWNRYIEYLSLPDDSAQPVAEELWGAWKWGLQGLYLDPNERYSNVAFIPLGSKEALMIFQPPKKEGEGVRYVSYIGRPKIGKVIFEFDVSLPIKKQLHVAEKTLLQHRQELKDEGVAVQETPKLRRDPDDWKILLRVLDAKAAGVKNKEIASVLFPNEQSKDIYAGTKKVDDKYNQAIRYVNQDYRFIP
jgi:hypothetical protein